MYWKWWEQDTAPSSIASHSPRTQQFASVLICTFFPLTFLNIFYWRNSSKAVQCELWRSLNGFILAYYGGEHILNHEQTCAFMLITLFSTLIITPWAISKDRLDDRHDFSTIHTEYVFVKIPLRSTKTTDVRLIILHSDTNLIFYFVNYFKVNMNEVDIEWEWTSLAL